MYSSKVIYIQTLLSQIINLFHPKKKLIDNQFLFCFTAWEFHSCISVFFNYSILHMHNGELEPEHFTSYAHGSFHSPMRSHFLAINKLKEMFPYTITLVH